MKHPKITRAAQGVAALILLIASGMKFVGEPGSVEVFVELGMEPTGRYLIACIELSASLLLLSPYAALGSVVALSVMCGAVIAHVSQLGFALSGDGVMQLGLLASVLTCSIYVLIARRSELPFIGENL